MTEDFVLRPVLLVPQEQLEAKDSKITSLQQELEQAWWHAPAALSPCTGIIDKYQTAHTFQLFQKQAQGDEWFVFCEASVSNLCRIVCDIEASLLLLSRARLLMCAL